MKRLIALILVFALSFCLVGCNLINSVKEKATEKIEEVVTDAVKDEAYNKAMGLISEGKLEEAFLILSELDGHEKAEAELRKLRFMPTKIIMYGLDESGNKTYQCDIELFYDERNLPIQFVQVYTDGEKYISDLIYSDNGNLIKCTEKDASTGEVDFVIEKMYDTRGNLVKVIHTYGWDDSRLIWEYTYDENDNLIKITSLQNGSTYAQTYTYDINGNLARMDCASSDGFVDFTLYTYDANNNLIKAVTTYPDSNKQSVTTYVYDSKGREIEEISIDISGNESHNYTTYDTYGNPIKFVYVDQNSSQSVIEAEFKLVYLQQEMSDEAYDTLKADFSLR